MKLNKSILAVALGLSVAGLAQAGDVYLTGSTAMRSTVYAALMHAGTVFTTTPTFWGYGGSGSGDNYMAFQGTLVGGSGTTTIYATWSGSEDGIQHIVQNGTLNQNFIPSSIVSANPSGFDTGGTPPSYDSKPCDLAMADNAQSFSRTKSPTLNNGTEVGVITFEWIRSRGLWTGTNVTDSQIQQALNGGAKRAVFSGNATDTNDYVYVSGRDSGSGTRVNAFGNAGYGILTTPKQIEMDTQTNGVMQYFTTTVHGITTTNYIGDWGFSSGGTLCKTLGADTTAQADKVHTNSVGYSVIAYAGVGDADAGIGAGAVLLNYNGVPFTTNNVVEGTYTFWGNEYIYAANSVNSGTEANSVYLKLADGTTGITAFCDGRKAIALTAMHCSRGGPTAVPVHN